MTTLDVRRRCYLRFALRLCALMVCGCDGVFSGGSGPSVGSGVFGTGLEPAPEDEWIDSVLDQLLRTEGPLLSGEGLPPSNDLSPWLPPALNQETQSSCVGFALGYALKTYHEARERGWDLGSDFHQFSPSFVFDRINRHGCSSGASLRDGLDLLINEGCLTIDVAPYDKNTCTDQAGAVDLATASLYRIRTAIPIQADHVDTIRTYLANGQPVVVGLNAYVEWFVLNQDDYVYDSRVGAALKHAVLAVAYDDRECVIKVFNSYGSEWGDDGYALIPYDFWPQVVLAGYVTEDEAKDPPLHFNAPIRYELARGPDAVAGGDLDGDGDFDLAVGVLSTRTVIVELNNGDGTFEEAGQYPVGDFTVSLALGDLDGDGDLDIVAANLFDDDVSILLNEGDASFADQVRYAVDSPISAVLGDLDGDSDLDLVVANRDGSSVTVLLNHGDGTFAAPLSGGPGALGTSVGKYPGKDGDAPGLGKAVGAGDVSAQVSPPDPGGDVELEPIVYPVGPAPYSVALGDLNADGNIDLAVANRGALVGFDEPEADAVSILLNNGDGTYALPVDYTVGDAPDSVTLEDMDGDGDRDLIVGLGESYEILLLLNRGDGTFGPPTNLDVDFPPGDITTGDVDGDGDTDLMATDFIQGVRVLLNDGNGFLEAPLSFGTRGGFPTRNIAVGDFDGDGYLDLAVTNGGTNDVAVLLNQPS